MGRQAQASLLTASCTTVPNATQNVPNFCQERVTTEVAGQASILVQSVFTRAPHLGCQSEQATALASPCGQRKKSGQVGGGGGRCTPVL